MITRMLCELGLFAGNDLEANYESLLFLGLNDWLLAQASAAWDNPGAIRWLTANSEILALTEEYLRYRLGSWPVRRYLGLRRYAAGRRPLGIMPGPWGWKDPRNTFTLPVWIRLFPAASVVHVYRNGVDVAASLRARERRGMELGRRRHRRRLRYGLYRWFQKGRGFVYSARCLDLRGGFSLWTEYLERAFTTFESGAYRVVHVKYENFVKSPQKELHRLAEFCGLPADESRILKAAAAAEVSGANRYAEDPELVEFHRKLKADPWMQKLGY